MLDDRVHAEDVDVNGRAGRKKTGRRTDHLHHDRRFGHPQAGTTELRRHGNAEPASLGNGLGKFVRKRVRAVELAPVVIVKALTNGLNGFAQGDAVWGGGHCLEHGALLM